MKTVRVSRVLGAIRRCPLHWGRNRPAGRNHRRLGNSSELDCIRCGEPRNYRHGTVRQVRRGPCLAPELRVIAVAPIRDRLLHLLAATIVAAGFAGAVAAQEAVDLELVLLADASGSIDTAEIIFQRRGYADAITAPEVLNAIARGFLRRIAVTYVEWGDERSQEVVVPWTIIDGPERAAAFAETLLAQPRLAFGRNAIGSAITFAHALIRANKIEGTRKIIDISADSANSWGGIPIFDARALALEEGITINGLAILCRGKCGGRPVLYDVEKAFADTIIGGPGSFVITADGRDRFAEGVRRKLILEIADRGNRRRG